jgi:RNA polymerase sigma factor (TIGR02999 family)
MSEVSVLLRDISDGDAASAERLLPLVYEELRRLATHKLRQEGAQHTLQPTALVHEAYLRLIGQEEMAWESKGHFFVAASEAMHRILVESARRRRSQKRGGLLQRQELYDDAVALPEPEEDILALNEALEKFSAIDPLKAKLVKLRYFAALTGAEAAQVLGISTASADRYWAYARAWLHQELQSDGAKD